MESRCIKILALHFYYLTLSMKKEPTFVGSDSIARTGLGPVTDRI